MRKQFIILVIFVLQAFNLFASNNFKIGIGPIFGCGIFSKAKKDFDGFITTEFKGNKILLYGFAANLNFFTSQFVFGTYFDLKNYNKKQSYRIKNIYNIRCERSDALSIKAQKAFAALVKTFQLKDNYHTVGSLTHFQNSDIYYGLEPALTLLTNKHIFHKKIDKVISAGVSFGYRITDKFYIMCCAGMAHLNAKYKITRLNVNNVRQVTKQTLDDLMDYEENISERKTINIYNKLIENNETIVQKINKNGFEVKGLINFSFTNHISANIHISHIKTIKVSTCGLGISFMF